MQITNKHKFVLLLLAIILAFNLANAQNNNIEKTAQQVEGAANTLIDLFGKKKDKQNSLQNESFSNNSNNFGLFKAGSIIKTAKYIECDFFEPFNKGAAVIRKGNDYALINAKGVFVVPFGKYTTISTNARIEKLGGDLTETGFFYATYKDQSGKIIGCFLNAQGKKIIEIGAETGINYAVTYDRKFLVYAPKNGINNADDGTMVAIGQDGKKFNLTQNKNFRKAFEYVFADSILIYGDKVGDKILLGFKDINNKIIVKPSFNSIEPFSDGVAIIGKLDDLGKMKYGIIDKNGKIRVEPIFQNKPENYSNGVSFVQSTKGYENSVYIDKNGKVLLQHNPEFYKKFAYVRRKIGKYFITNDAVIDSLGKVITKANYLKAFGVNQTSIPGLKSVNFDFDIKSTDGQLRLVFYFSNDRIPGVLNIKENKIIYGNFYKTESTRSLRLDPYSNLIYTIVVSSNNKQTEGYMNTSGEFVIVKKPTAYTGL